MSHIVIAPFSNSDIRDWPVPHWAALVGDLVKRLEDPAPTIRLIGTAGQRVRANDIVRHFEPDRVRNECGRLSWPEVMHALGSAACVVGNNSGMAHLSGRLGVPTVCVFGGSHQRLEWRPLGFDVVVLSPVIACSPCHLDHGAACPYGKACLEQIDPATVADTVVGMLRRGATRPHGGQSGPAQG